MPLKVYREHFEPNIKMKAKAAISPLSVSTSFYTECEIAKDLGMTYEQYKKSTSRKERKLQILFRILASEKERYAYQQSKEEAEREARLNDGSPGQGVSGRLRG